MAVATLTALATTARDARADALAFSCGSTIEQPVFAQGSGLCQFPAFGQTTFSSATADLASGVLRGDAIGKSINARDADNNPIVTDLPASAAAQIDDTVTVHGPTSWTGAIPITLSLHVDGELLGLTGARASISLRMQSSAGLSDEFVAATWDGEFARLAADGNGSASVPNDAAPVLLVPIGNPVHHANTGDGVLIGFDASVTALVDPTDPTASIEAILSVVADPDGALIVGENEADFTNTALLGITLPEGFSFTSGSGVLLDAVTAPEPASLTLMLAGLLGFGAMRRREVGGRTLA